ncbi:YjcZ family sporulation protein [Paenibacillus elgii]
MQFCRRSDHCGWFRRFTSTGVILVLFILLVIVSCSVLFF